MRHPVAETVGRGLIDTSLVMFSRDADDFPHLDGLIDVIAI